uniref:hypothetical protein n=1 Tax=Altererythrobacter segetis TaxID=1104773 RepID=UPI00140729E9|nr:hypothetical protein [Altererythrobacter segetis]
MPNVSARTRAFAQLVGILLLIVAATASSPRKVDPTPYLASAREMSDLQLYQAIAGKVARGQGYYPTAVKLQREHDFPVRPFVTVRLPTLAWAVALVGPGALLALQALLLLAGALAWFAALSGYSRPERYGAVALYAVFGGSMIGLAETAQHEVWAGLLLSLALPLASRFPNLAVVLGLLASLIRELAAPFLGLIALLAWLERDRATSAKALGALAVVCLALAAHYFALTSLTLPGDPATQGWLGLGGPAALLRDISAITTADPLPPFVLAALSFGPMLGWLSLPGRTGRLAALWFGGVLFAVIVLGRSDNLRWIDMLMPGYFVGLALVPRGIFKIGGKAPS